MNAILTPPLPTRIIYRLGLRQWVNRAQRFRYERGAPRLPLPEFRSPEEAIVYVMDRWSWGSDNGRSRALWSDWSSHPEVLEARLVAGDDELGDCDDLATWFAAAVAPIVDRVLILSVWTLSGGHTVCVYDLDGALVVVDYELMPVASYEAAVAAIRSRYGYGYTGPIGWVFETPDLQLVAAGGYP